MDIDAFEIVIDETMMKLPEWVREAMVNIEIIVAEEPEPDLHPEGDDLLGLYVGLPLPEREANHAGELPDVIYIFRRPHLDMGLPAPELRAEIETTLIHEIAHYFGIDDDHLDEIGWG